MRLAFVDLLFSWPPNGGADVDLYHVVSGLQAAGHEVHLVGVHEMGSHERGRFDPAALPFPATRLDFASRELRPEPLAVRVRNTVDGCRPDIVFIHHGYALKPYITEALAHHVTVARYYAHELACARDVHRYKDGKPCPNDYLRTPDACRACACESQRNAIESWRFFAWTRDYLSARAYRPEYHHLVRESLRRIDAVIVSNQALKAHLSGYHDAVSVIPGGVSISKIEFKPIIKDIKHHKKIILMPGRADDPLKGLDVLRQAGRILASRRADFEIWATHYDHTLSEGWFRAIGWHDYRAALALYRQADIVVVPSLWEEPFGLVAVEAMAAARPVCASRVGGLQEIVRHLDTGFLFPRNGVAELAKQLELLLDNADLRARMGAAGRQVAEAEYDWPSIIRRHYLPLIEGLARRNRVAGTAGNGA